MKYTKHYQTRETPQSQPIPGSTQVPNNAGGYAWGIDDWARLDRFLILGSEGGTYYVDEKTLTIRNADAVARCIKEDGLRVVKRAAEISHTGRAPKNDPALFVLAMCMSPDFADTATRQAAADQFNSIVRIGTHLFNINEMAKDLRGWGRAWRQVNANWYTDKSPGALAYQVVKYQQRGGWSHRDILRLSHPKPPTKAHDVIFKWIVSGELPGALPADIARTQQVGLGHIVGYEHAKHAKSEKEIVNLIHGYGLTREMIPTQWLNSAVVWDALLTTMPMTAMIRNLAKMTSVGLISPMSMAVKAVCQRLDSDAVAKVRVHPLQVLVALEVYRRGRGIKGSMTWTPVPQVIDALDAAFYHAFGNVEPSGKRTMLALDVSSSMFGWSIAGMAPISPAVGAAAMAMVTARVEQNWAVMGFAHNFRSIPITPRQRLDDVVKTAYGMGFGGTDCSIPMTYATKHKIPVDTFVIYTDNETWAGRIHPAQALREYRNAMGIPAKLVVVGMVASGFSIADPNDAGMMDVVGFDTATPQLITDFSKAEVARA